MIQKILYFRKEKSRQGNNANRNLFSYKVRWPLQAIGRKSKWTQEQLLRIYNLRNDRGKRTDCQDNTEWNVSLVHVLIKCQLEWINVYTLI